MVLEPEADYVVAGILDDWIRARLGLGCFSTGS